MPRRAIFLVLVLSLACNSNKSASEVKTEPAFTDGKTDPELLSIARATLEAGDHVKASAALRAVSPDGVQLPEAYELRVAVYKDKAHRCGEARDWQCQIETLTYALKDQAVISLSMCPKANTECERMEQSAKALLANAVPASLQSCWEGAKEECQHATQELSALLPMYEMNNLKQKAVDEFVAAGGHVTLPLPEDALCVAMNHATTGSPIAGIISISRETDWRMTYKTISGKRKLTHCKVSGSTINFTTSGKWNTQSTVSYQLEVAKEGAFIIISQRWHSDGSQNTDRIPADQLSQFGLSTEIIMDQLRQSL